MEKYEAWLQNDRLKRELRLQLHNSLSKIADKFIYLRTDGLQRLLELLRSFSPSEIPVFNELQEQEELNVAVALMTHILRPPPAEWSPVSPQEKALALDILQGALGMHPKSKSLFAKAEGLPCLLDCIDAPGQSPVTQLAALDALLSALAEHEGNQELFSGIQGFERLIKIIRHSKTHPKEVRTKVAEVLLLVARYSTADSVRKKVIGILGEKSMEQLSGLVTLDASEAQSAEYLRFLEKRLEKAK